MVGVINSKQAPTEDKLHPFYQFWVLLNTERGTVPLKREIGLNPAMVDKPITTIQQGIEADMQDQVNKYIKGLIIKNYQPIAKDNGLEFIWEVELDG